MIFLVDEGLEKNRVFQFRRGEPAPLPLNDHIDLFPVDLVLGQFVERFHKA